MPKTQGSNSEIRSDISCVQKPKVFPHRNTTFDNINTYLRWRVMILEQELEEELIIKRDCCKRKRPRCQLCYEKRCHQKYDNPRRKFIALRRIKDINSREKLGIKGAVV